ncbi:HIG1 domain family member 1A, mitochondrial-like [Neocloeon triangulifer]|uniref:HIG1 domain family member 1A, mitochondrial-like n=1 Tax=Neocloeon triangulifer TaxID=2078957 RepID=UPI00286F1144|nr:HIG1 domain family member 1A, mitochondrial-like [Neocloeon triangulifer]
MSTISIFKNLHIAPRFPSTMSTPTAKFAPASPNFGDESRVGKLQRKMQEAPLFPIGIMGLLGALGYGAYSFKKKGNMSTSVFLMQLRVTAQGAVVVCLTAGVGYSLIRDFVLPKMKSAEH